MSTNGLVSSKNQLTSSEVDEVQEMAQKLLKTGHYQKLGKEGIFAIVMMAKATGADAIQALNGGMYFIDGKVEMDGKLMLALIRQRGHSITKDPKSTSINCILHGRRADNGDTWTESFSLEEAKTAGLLSRGSYQKYGKDMFQWRALGRLARFLFPDVIKGCYVQGEIQDSAPINDPVDRAKEDAIAIEILKKEAPEEAEKALEVNVEKNKEIQAYLPLLSDEEIQRTLDFCGVDSFDKIKPGDYDALLKSMRKKYGRKDDGSNNVA